ncbi:TonB family protein [Carboxylicivirga taeanensis]|uniref:TonB family protein n=1 Tax=Carboxylicivirga taeanensis TaxID=1416875 RepID=UPI003F6DC45A
MKDSDYLRAILLLCLVIIASIATNAQERVLTTRLNGYLKEVCWAHALDTTLRQGESITYYKGRVIERGRYRDNLRVGRWKFYNLRNIIDYEYDFDSDELIMVSGQDRHDLKRNSPCLFIGSPLIPYLFLVNNLSYPQSAVNKAIEGRVVLALKINELGEVFGFYIAQKLHPAIDKAVMEVATTMPADWRFFAATKMGQSVQGEYHIAIEFHLD